uniref:Uncharacterized protein n=1 Tax=Chlorobium chlorochromatii (strain CaD3) TaxID=340177 RepID=Q3ASP4_CHLCH
MKKSAIKKALCKLDKETIEKQMEALMELVAEPRYICRKCARVASTKRHLCKPVAITNSNGSKKRAAKVLNNGVVPPNALT